MAISLAKLAIHLVTETGGMVAGFAKAQSMAKGFAASGGGIGAALGGAGMFNPWIAGGTALAGVFGAVAYKGVAFNSMMEQAQAAFAGFTGSTQTAKALLGDLFSFAATTAFL